jgi:hypothetical protein
LVFWKPGHRVSLSSTTTERRGPDRSSEAVSLVVSR